MFNWPSYAIGMAISHELTIVNIDKRGKLFKKIRCPLMDSIIHQGEIVNVDLFIKNIGSSFRGKSLVLAINDDWVEQQSFTINSAHKKAITYLIKQKVSPNNIYDYHVYEDQCVIWQLSKTRFQSYQLMAKKMGLRLTCIEPSSCAQLRLFAKKLPQPYGIYCAPMLYVVAQDRLIFSHQVINNELEPALALFEELYQQTIHHLVTHQDCVTSLKTSLVSVECEPEFITAYSAAGRLYV